MTIIRNYIGLIYILIVPSLIAGILATWTVISSRPEYKFVAIGMQNRAWATVAFSVLEILLYLNIPISPRNYLHGTVQFRVILINYLSRFSWIAETVAVIIFTGLWSKGLQEFTSNIKYYCVDAGQCAQMKACAVFGALSLACFVARLAYLIFVMGITCCLKFHIKHMDQCINVDPVLPKIGASSAPSPSAPKTNDTSAPGEKPIDICVQCRQLQCLPNSVFCGASCINIAGTGTPRLIEVPLVHSMFREISEQFHAGWENSSGKPLTKRIFAVIMTQEQDRVYKIYREGVEIKRNYVPQGMQPGNQQLLWHGTSRECALGDRGSETLCPSVSCTLCNIIRFSFDINRYGPRSGRLGKGIYLSASSSKAHEFCHSRLKSQWTATLLTSVVVGKTYPLRVNQPQLVRPPDGYDSVLGEGVPAQSDETVVYGNDAIRPAFLVLYQPPPPLPV